MQHFFICIRGTINTASPNCRWHERKMPPGTSDQCNFPICIKSISLSLPLPLIATRTTFIRKTNLHLSHVQAEKKSIYNLLESDVFVTPGVWPHAFDAFNLYIGRRKVLPTAHVTICFMLYLLSKFKQSGRGLDLDSPSYQSPLRHKGTTKACQDQFTPPSVHFLPLFVISFPPH